MVTKKIIQKTEPDEVDSKKSIITVLAIIAGVVIILIAAYIIFKDIQSNPKNLNNNVHVVYNNNAFNKQSDNLWYVLLSIRKQPYNIPFYYNPYQAEAVRITNESMRSLATFINTNPYGLVYITVEPNESAKIVVSAVEVARIFGQKYNILNMDVRAAVTSAPKKSVGTNETAQYPIITCDNADNETLVLWITIGEENSITSQGNCIILKAITANESVMVADAMTYRILQITS